MEMKKGLGSAGLWISVAWLVVLVLTFYLGLKWSQNQMDELRNEIDSVPEGWIEVEQCLVWGNQYDKNTLTILCVDFIDEDFKCQWQVQPDNSIYIWTDNIDNGTVLPCTQKVMALQKIQ